MKAHNTPRTNARPDFNHLTRGARYTATTRHGATTGEYLGIEAPYGEWAIILRHRAGSESIAVESVTAIRAAA